MHHLPRTLVRLAERTLSAHMPISIFDAARYVLEKSRWHITQLDLQKLLCIGQMERLGEFGRPLPRVKCEAWKYDPVNVPLREHTKQIGVEALWPESIKGYAKPVRKGTSETDVLDKLIKSLSGMTEAELISITHWEKGAWSRTNDSGYWNLDVPEPLMRDGKSRMNSRWAGLSYAVPAFVGFTG